MVRLPFLSGGCLKLRVSEGVLKLLCPPFIFSSLHTATVSLDISQLLLIDTWLNCKR